MSRIAKTGDDAGRPPLLRRGADLRGRDRARRDRAVLAVIGAGHGAAGAARRIQPDFLFSGGGLFAFMIGLFYSMLYVFGTLIYLDPREYSWAVPVNRARACSRSFVASYAPGLALRYRRCRSPQVLVAAGFVLARGRRAQLSAARAARSRMPRRSSAPPRRSSSAAATRVARRSRRRSRGPSWRAGAGGAEGIFATSAGVGRALPGTPMAPEAAAALARARRKGRIRTVAAADPRALRARSR